MGIDFKAVNVRDGTTVALKILQPQSLLDEEVKHRFLREANAGSRLVHPNIVKIYEVGEVDGKHYISMEFVEGRNLQQVLKDGPMAPGRVVEIGIEVGEALREAHQKGVIHRDIKSLNIMLSPSGAVKVMDFGLAKIQNASMLTREGDMLGTVTYMSPEQASGESVDFRTDIFSLGVVLYELLTGKLPFGDQYDMAVVYAILNVEPAGIRESRPGVPEALEAIVLKAMRKDLQHRYQNVEELLGDLRRMKAFLDGKRDQMPSAAELVAGVGVEGIPSEVTQLSHGPRGAFEAKCAGRERELEVLKGLLRKADAGEGQTVLIAGEAGVGKTRLVSELEQYARAIKLHPINCRCVFREGSAAYRPFVALVRDLFAARGLVTRGDLEKYFAARAPALLSHLPVLQFFLNFTGQEEERIHSRDQLWDALLRLVEAVSHEKTLFLFIDDLHWADEESLRLLQYLARNCRGVPVFLVGTYRPEDVPASRGKVHPLLELEQELGKEGCLTAIRLDRLTGADIVQMVSSLFPGAQFGTGFADSLFRESEGNPLFVMEILKLLKIEGVIQAEAGTYRLTGDLESVGMPSQIQDIVVRRVEKLGRQEREILEIGAVEGEVFHSETIGRCLEMGRLVILRKLQSLERDYHIIHAQAKAYRFDHAKIRDALYDAISPELRTEYHRLLGEYLVGEHREDPQFAPQIAHHFLEGGEEGRALGFLIRGGEHARALFANLRAVQFYEQALQIANREERLRGVEPSEKESILEGLGEINTMLGNHERARAMFGELLSRPGLAAVRRADLLQRVGRVDIITGDHENVLARLAEAASVLGDAGTGGDAVERSVLGKILVSRARVLKSRGEYDSAIREIGRGLELLGEEGHLQERADALNDLGNIYEDRSEYARAQEMYSASLRLREEIADKKGIAVTYNNLANIFCAQGDYPNAAAMFRKSLDLMKEIGFREGIAGTCNNLGTIYQDQGRYRDALELQKMGLRVREEIGDRPGIAMSYGNLGFVQLDLGDYAAARELLSRSVRMQEALGMKTLLSATTAWLALATAESGEVEEGLALARKSLAMASDLGQKWFEGIASRSLGMILRMKWGEGGEEREYAESSACLRRSLSVFAEGKFEHEAARSSLELGRLLKKGGDPESERCLRQAVEVFQKLGAMGDLERALQLSSHH